MITTEEALEILRGLHEKKANVWCGSQFDVDDGCNFLIAGRLTEVSSEKVVFGGKHSGSVAVVVVVDLDLDDMIFDNLAGVVTIGLPSRMSNGNREKILFSEDAASVASVASVVGGETIN